jgi:hypothetical protein
LIEAILLKPDGDKLKITLKGDMAGMLSGAGDTKRLPESDDFSPPVSAGLAADAMCPCGKGRREEWLCVSPRGSGDARLAKD